MKKRLGFTLLELMVVVAIIAILAMVAYPMFTSQLRKSRRSEARQALADLALRQEKYRSYNTTYADCDTIYGGVGKCTTENGYRTYYTIAVTANSATGFTATATPKDDQVKDSCGTLTYQLSATVITKSPSGCW